MIIEFLFLYVYFIWKYRPAVLFTSPISLSNIIFPMICWVFKMHILKIGSFKQDYLKLSWVSFAFPDFFQGPCLPDLGLWAGLLLEPEGELFCHFCGLRL